MPLLFRGAVNPVLKWLQSISVNQLDARPSLWVMYASALLMTGQMSAAEQRLHAAEQALLHVEDDDTTLDLIGHIASIRATVAVSRHQAEVIFAESLRALNDLHPDNLPVRAAATWTLGYAHQLQGKRMEAGTTYSQALMISKRIGHLLITIMATLGLGNIQEAENQLVEAAESYRRVLEWAGEPPLPVACEAHLGLARILYEWNECETALLHGQQSAQLARQFEDTDRGVAAEVILAKLKLARGEGDVAAAMLAGAENIACQQKFFMQMPYIAAAQVSVLIHQGKLEAADILAQQYEEHISQAKVKLALGDTNAALGMLEKLLVEAEADSHKDELLKIRILIAAALYKHDDINGATQHLAAALRMGEAGCFIRIFVDEGWVMKRLLSDAELPGEFHGYRRKLLAAFDAEKPAGTDILLPNPSPSVQPLIENLSGRELEILQLIAQGLSNREISERLYLALSTVKGYNRNIFDKLQVSRRTEAVAYARILGLL